MLAASLLQHLDATQAEAAAHHLDEASASAEEYGRVAAALGLSLSQTVEVPPLPRAVPPRARGRGPPARLRYDRDDGPPRIGRARDGPPPRRDDDRPRSRHGARSARALDHGAVGRRTRGVTLVVPGAVVALTAHARHVPADDRVRFAQRLHDELGDRAVFVETCHRVEAYVVGEPDATRPRPWRSSTAVVLAGDAAVRHAITVAVGRDSVVVGEDQVLHQLRLSVDAARAAGALDPALERLFALALRAGRRARAWRPKISCSSPPSAPNGATRRAP